MTTLSSPQTLFTMQLSWHVPNRTGHATSSDPTSISDTEVRGRPAWDLEFVHADGQAPVHVAIDKELGLTLAWEQGAQRLELSDAVLDEEFPPSLFAWDGPTVDPADVKPSSEELAHRRRMEAVAAIPPTVIDWVPTRVDTTPTDGDPATGALDVMVTARYEQFLVRRWPTARGEPVPSERTAQRLAHLPVRGRTESEPWTLDLRSVEPMADGDVARVLATLALPEPPNTADAQLI